MKKYIYLLSIAALGLTACEKEYLNTTPEDQMGTTTILSTTEYAELALNGICRAMSNQYLGTQVPSLTGMVHSQEMMHRRPIRQVGLLFGTLPITSVPAVSICIIHGSTIIS